MKGIFKKTLACAIAACALTSSVTAFAAGTWIDTDTVNGSAYVNGNKYDAKGVGSVYGNRYNYSIEESTEITTKPLSSDEMKGFTLTINWHIKNDETGAQFGGFEGDSKTNTNKVSKSSTVDYVAPIKRFTAICTHAAYKKDSQGNDVRELRANTETNNY